MISFVREKVSCFFFNKKALLLRLSNKNSVGGPNKNRTFRKKIEKGDVSGHIAGTLSATLVLVGSSIFCCSPSVLSAGAFSAEHEICISKHNVLWSKIHLYTAIQLHSRYCSDGKGQ